MTEKSRFPTKADRLRVGLALQKLGIGEYDGWEIDHDVEKYTARVTILRAKGKVRRSALVFDYEIADLSPEEEKMLGGKR